MSGKISPSGESCGAGTTLLSQWLAQAPPSWLAPGKLLCRGWPDPQKLEAPVLHPKLHPSPRSGPPVAKALVWVLN